MLQEGVGEPEHQEVEHLLLAEEVVDAVDRRDHPDRDLTAIERHLVELLPTPRPHLHPLLVTDDPAAGAEAYAHELQLTWGDPPVLDLVQLGLGSDGHTASLFPDDAASLRARADVTVTQPAAGHRRATLTIPVLRGARQQLWIVARRAKAGAVGRLVDGDDSPASRVSRPDAVLLLDAAELDDDAGPTPLPPEG